MSKPKVAINGFGRIGRMSFQANLENEVLDIIAVNDPGNIEDAALLLKYDSVYGISDAEVEVKDANTLVVNGKEIAFSNELDPEKLPWKELEIDIVLECTGVFRDHAGASKHLTAGAKKVIISAPSKDPDGTFCMGINHEDYDPEKHIIISNASCTTNGLAPVVKVLDEHFGIEKGLMTTIHSYTNDQKLTDAGHKKDIRRARAAGLNMIPTSTGAARAIGLVMPHLEGKLDGVSVRVPTPTVSLVDAVFEVKEDTTIEEVNDTLEAAANGPLKGILAVSHLPLVSMDYKKNPNSSIVDAEMTKVVGNMIKIFAWYDNEWGYSMRLIELAAHMATKK
jgi:glyceraldehyde 3-phosphate dehydrogenase